MRSHYFLNKKNSKHIMECALTAIFFFKISLTCFIKYTNPQSFHLYFDIFQSKSCEAHYTVSFDKQQFEI